MSDNKDNKDNKNPSTLQSYVDSATGAVQEAISSITGNTHHKAEADAKHQKTDAEHDASDATAKLPGFTASSGGVTRDHPDRITGSRNQTIGAAKEFAGGLIGSEVSSTSPIHHRQPLTISGTEP